MYKPNWLLNHTVSHLYKKKTTTTKCNKTRQKKEREFFLLAIKSNSLLCNKNTNEGIKYWKGTAHLELNRVCICDDKTVLHNPINGNRKTWLKGLSGWNQARGNTLQVKNNNTVFAADERLFIFIKDQILAPPRGTLGQPPGGEREREMQLITLIWLDRSENTLSDIKSKCEVASNCWQTTHTHTHTHTLHDYMSWPEIGSLKVIHLCSRKNSWWIKYSAFWYSFE